MTHSGAAPVQDEFAELVRRIEADADRNLALYKLKVLLLALLGYAYIFFVLAVLLAVVALLFWTILTGKGLNSIVIKLEIGLLVLMSIVARAMWVKVPAPEGIELTKEQAPALFETVEEIRRAVDGPVVHSIQITDEFNASVVSVPRLGLFGWPRHYLLIGLPLTHAVSAAEFRAVLAHELGHLAGAHGRFSSWIYRIRKTWDQLMSVLESRRHWGTWFFNRFFKWYVSFFGAYSFVLARRHEYEADLCASEIATAQTTANMLIRIEIYGWLVSEKFWNEVCEQVKKQGEPPSPFSQMPASLRAGLKSDEADRWLKSALERQTESYDIHPSLKDRLSALGQQPQPAAITESAAEAYLAETLDELTKCLNLKWQEENGDFWKEEHERFQTIDRELRELNQRAENSTLTVEETFKRAYLIELTENDQAALPFYREALNLDENDARSNFAVGRILLSQDRTEGVLHLERAMDQQERFIPLSCQLLANYFHEKGDVVAAQKYSRRFAEFSRVASNAWAERNQVSFVERFISHDLPDGEVEQLRSELAKNARIREAYLVRKELKYQPDTPLYTLGLVFDQNWLKRSNGDSEFAKKLPTTLKTSWQLYSFVLDAQNKRLEAILRQIPNSLIYQRHKTREFQK